jgi:hypothetical protein
MLRLRVLLAVISATLPFSVARAQPYMFRSVADSNGPFSYFRHASLNSSRMVAFDAGLDDGRQGVYSMRDGNFTDISHGLPNILLTSEINEGGTLAFVASNAGIFAGNGGPLTVVAARNTTYPLHGVEAAINDAKAVVIRTLVEGNNREAIVTRNGDVSTIIDLATPGRIIEAGGINSHGTVAYKKTMPNGRDQIFTGDGGPTTLILSDELLIIPVSRPRIDDDGTVVFAAYRADQNLYYANSVYAANPTQLTIFADDSGPYRYFESPSIKNGHVAFLAGLDDQGLGIFTGNDAYADAVIQTGDSLFGSTVIDLNFYRGVNSHGDIAFIYTLANGMSGVAVALVPEPSTFAIAAAGLIAASLMRGRLTGKKRGRIKGDRSHCRTREYGRRADWC